MVDQTHMRVPRRAKAPSNVKLDATSTSPATPIAITTATFKRKIGACLLLQLASASN